VTNPDPVHITDAMWMMWTERPDSTWKLGGIYANKKCYHNTVNANIANWPGAYCVILPLDLKGLLNKARAIDYTMSDAKMVVYTRRLKNSALDPDDPRLNAMREFYGTTDNKTVYGLIKDTTTGAWRRSSSDLSHLWHIHISIFTLFCDDWTALEPILSVLSGETLAEWRARMAVLDEDDVTKIWRTDDILESPSLTRTGAKRTQDQIDANKWWTGNSYLEEIYNNIGRGRGDVLGLGSTLTTIQADITKLIAQNELLTQTLNAIATGGTSVDTSVVLTKIEEVSNEFEQTINELRDENLGLRQRLAAALGGDTVVTPSP
jgi:hypothetical protein